MCNVGREELKRWTYIKSSEISWLIFSSCHSMCVYRKPWWLHCWWFNNRTDSSTNTNLIHAYTYNFMQVLYCAVRLGWLLDLHFQIAYMSNQSSYAIGFQYPIYIHIYLVELMNVLHLSCIYTLNFTRTLHLWICIIKIGATQRWATMKTDSQQTPFTSNRQFYWIYKLSNA